MQAHPVTVTVKTAPAADYSHVIQGEIIQVAHQDSIRDYVALVLDSLHGLPDAVRLVVLHPEAMRGQVWHATQPVAVRKFFTRVTIE